MAEPVIVTPAVLAELAPPQPEGEAHKGMRGSVLVVGGTSETPGAALLAGIAALRAGAGVLQVATAASVARALAVALPEARVIALPETDGGDIAGCAGEQLCELATAADAVLVGPGLADEAALAELVPSLIAAGAGGFLVVDAKALDAVTPSLAADHRHRVVLTPNAKEGASLLDVEVDEVNRDLRASHGKLVARFGCTVALRAGETFAGGPGQPTYHDSSGRPGLGSSGSGDVLAGYLTGLLARGTPPLAAAVWAVHVHAQAGRRLSSRIGRLGYLARELLDELASTAAELGA